MSKESDITIHFISEASITSCLAAILIWIWYDHSMQKWASLPVCWHIKFRHLSGGQKNFSNMSHWQCIIITCLLYEQKTRHFYSFYLTNEHHFLFGGHLEFLNLKLIWPFNASSLVYYISKKPDISIHFISQTSITSCLAAILNSEFVN